ncbi:MAG: T9SS type A sorting domain-containing protein [Saprospiraceae bacterium]|nr:T9SS type A sorting domain-containing protein [Saprospiraceae bacterium]
MRTAIILYILFFSISEAYTQKNDYSWLLGYEPGGGFDPDSNIGFSNIVFDQGINNSYYINGKGSMLFTNASISHPATGELLAYTDGCRIFNRNFEIMENGNHINFGIRWTLRCETNEFTYYPVTNSSLIIPRPAIPNEYYIIHAKDSITPQVDFFIEKLLYSTIVFGNNMDGEVINKNKTIYKGKMYNCDLHAVKHANGSDWWVMMMGYQNNTYMRFLIQKDSLYLHSTQDIGPVDDPGGGSNLQLSPDGTQLARFSRGEGIVLFNFNRASGELSNLRQWVLPDTTFTYYATGAFSPSSRYVYINNTHRLWQLDTWAPDFAASAVQIAEYDGFVWKSFFTTAFQYMAIGPDCKMYMNTDGTTPFLHVVHQPDLPGQACGFEQRAVMLPATNGKCLPNLVNYRLDTGPVCDSTLSTSTFLPVRAETLLLDITPTPATDQVIVSLPESLPGGNLAVYDVQGRQVYSAAWPGQQIEININGWSAGHYFINLYDVDGRYASGRMVVE